MQRWLCKDCGRRYLQLVKPELTRPLNRAEPNFLLVAEDEKHAEHLVCVQVGTEKGGELERCEQIQNSDLLKDFPDDLRPKILKFAIKRENQGFKDVKSIVHTLGLLAKTADLRDTEAVKTAIKNPDVEGSTKNKYCERYELFLKFLGGT